MRDLRKTLASLLSARRQASNLEDRFFKQLASVRSHSAKIVSRAVKVRSARRTLKCPKCSRRFARPLHLGRHLSATHGRKKRVAA